jgi:sensor domain CHASE-containing protein
MNSATLRFGRQLTSFHHPTNIMSPIDPLEVTITLVQPELSELDQERLTQKLYQRLVNIPEIIAVDRVKDETQDKGQKGGRFIVGLIRAKATPDIVAQIAKITAQNYAQSGCATMQSSDSSLVSSANLTPPEFVAQVQDQIIGNDHE